MSQGLPGRKVQILVVEDNPADVDLLRLALSDADVNYDLTVIHDGGEALAYVQQHGGGDRPTHDLAILDLNIPKNDGLEILEAMRSTTAFRALPVAILTSSSSPRERSKLTTLNVARFIAKPLEFDEFMKIGPVLRQVLVSIGR